MINPLQPIPGVPDDLIRSLNDRFRQITTSTGARATAGARSTRIQDYAAGNQNPGDFFVEMDRGNALYQIQVGKWLLVSGSLVGVDASKPADLSVSDAGFLYRSTDIGREYRWSGSAWVDVTSALAGDVQVAYGSNASQGLTASYATVTGATLTLNRAGVYLISGMIHLAIGSGPDQLYGRFNLDGTGRSESAGFLAAGGYHATVALPPVVYTAATVGKVVLLEAKRTAAVSSICSGTNSSISALWISA